jgi:hypothetical protein
MHDELTWPWNRVPTAEEFLSNRRHKSPVCPDDSFGHSFKIVVVIAPVGCSEGAPLSTQHAVLLRLARAMRPSAPRTDDPLTVGGVSPPVPVDGGPLSRGRRNRPTKLAERPTMYAPDVRGVLAVRPPSSVTVNSCRRRSESVAPIHTVADQEPALEVNARYRVGPPHWRTACSMAQLALDRQSFALEQQPDRALHRPDHRGHVPSIKPIA